MGDFMENKSVRTHANIITQELDSTPRQQNPQVYDFGVVSFYKSLLTVT